MNPNSPNVNNSGKRYPSTGWFAHPVLSVLLGSAFLARQTVGIYGTVFFYFKLLPGNFYDCVHFYCI